jgi:transcriptional regulator with XRE-family HTH domain
MKHNIHIGSLIRQKQEEQGLSITEFAVAINCSRANVYSIFRRKSLDMEQLLRISKALKYDFIAEIYKPENKIPSKRIIIIESNEERFQELLSDNSIQIIDSWRMSE